ncbi:MAG: hypothetical protein DWQ01_04910 [Planctomycetota bacterium]|nr:MAG: hypothetical protein DWQ01_04910 [Planctomycetota bacterium]
MESVPSQSPLIPRSLISCFGTAALWGCLALPAIAQGGDSDIADRPNILIFLVDDMGWQESSVPFHGQLDENGNWKEIPTELNRRFRTPNIERLAREGMKFTQAYASAVCSPSRVSLLTGQQAARHMVTNWTLRKDRQPDHEMPEVRAADWNLNGLVAEAGIPRSVFAPTLAQRLSKAGYHTIHAGKAHFGAKDTSGSDPRNLGFQVNIAGHYAGGPGSYHGDKNFSAVWRNGDKIWDVPGLEKYHGQKINLTEALTREAIAALNANRNSGKPFFLYMSHYAVHAPWEADRRFVEAYRNQGLSELEAVHASMIESMDRSLGDLLKWLDDNEETDRTLVVFLSDNGSPKQMSRNLPLRGHKISPYEGGTRVPWLVRWPGRVPPATVQRTPVIIQDLFPTCLQAAGLEMENDRIDGQDLLPLFVGESGNFDRVLLWHFPNTYDQPPFSSIRSGSWKLIAWHIGRRMELFHLGDDLSESKDLAKVRPDKVKALASELGTRLRKLGARMCLDKKTGESLPWPDHWPAANPPTALADEWQFLGEAINEPGWDIWGGSPVQSPDGRVHLFVARWPGKFPFDPAWRTHSQIARYSADSPEGPFQFEQIVLQGDGKGWDAQGFHNPNVQRIGGRYALSCIANDGQGRHGPNQRIGIWLADRIEGPWSPAHGNDLKPMLEPPQDPDIWCHQSGCGVNNPALLSMPSGKFHLYFKAKAGPSGPTRMGLAIADRLEGPYRIEKDPVTANDRVIEDGYAFWWREQVCLLTTDNHGILEQGGGLLWNSRDGRQFDHPLPGFHHLGNHYFPEGIPEGSQPHYTRQVKCERPQILMIEEEPAYLYAPCGVALDGSDGTNLYLFRRRTNKK